MARCTSTFRAKGALLSAIIEREAAPLLAVEEEIAEIRECAAALRCYIRASIRHQMRRPRLAMLIDLAEKREIFSEQVTGTAKRLQAVVEGILRLPDAPRVANTIHCSRRCAGGYERVVDAAGERGEEESEQLLRRVEGTVWGYLRG